MSERKCLERYVELAQLMILDDDDSSQCSSDLVDDDDWSSESTSSSIDTMDMVVEAVIRCGQ
jgi:hypothetical protein